MPLQVIPADHVPQTHSECRVACVEPSELEMTLEQYATWIADAEPESSQFKRFRETWPSRFFELCRVHLAVLIDLPLEFLDDAKEAFACCSGSHSVDAGSERSAHGSVRWPLVPWPRLRCAPHAQTPSCFYDVESAKPCAVRTNRGASDVAIRVCANDVLARNILTLMDALDTKTRLSTEGIFRKTGNVIRQRTVRQRILSDKSLNVDALLEYHEPRPWKPPGRAYATGHSRKCIQSQLSPQIPLSPQINVHDLASGLKGVLYDLPEPLLTHRLLPLFVQVAGLTNGRIDDRGNRTYLRPIEEKIAAAKQLKALRLLCLLLPQSHSVLLRRLLMLLTHTLEHSAVNRMTADSLGTLFVPLLLSPSKVHPRDLHTHYNSLAKLATVMISHGVEGLWQVPKSFSQDVTRNLYILETNLSCYDPRHNRSESADTPRLKFHEHAPQTQLMRTQSSDSGLGWTDAGSQSNSDVESALFLTPTLITRPAELPDLVTSINFAVRSHLDNVDSPDCGETEYAVAELYATVQSLPDNDPRKRRLIQRFNATNGGLIPIELQTSLDTVRKTVQSNAPKFALNVHPRNRSPTPSANNFIRANTGSCAVKAAKTIRSSLRRRLALRSNVSVSTNFKSPSGRPLLELDIEQESNITPIASQILKTVSPSTELLTFRSMNLAEMETSPVFETHLTRFDSEDSFQMPQITAPSMSTNARISMVSSTSISSSKAGDLFFCCPLVEALTSPFRKRTTPSNHLRTPDTTSSTTTNTPVSRVLRNGIKRIRCLSPLTTAYPVEQLPPSCDAERTTEPSTSSTYASTNRDLYYPISMLDSTWRMEADAQADKKVKVSTNSTNSVALWKSSLQTSLLSFGYRTLAHTTGMTKSVHSTTQLRRIQTMPLQKRPISCLNEENLRPSESLVTFHTTFI
ncbi:Rho GTPase-activating protein 19 [Paragonimus heterotremus]|uniref:Rho GTPase-activating protein 19 n=1 Tax=Paragonimus heterotremus TaxID=100268 RepID=A0A8J4TIC0_9TREM|nr:Rho GTPase-activating protein 19 [Paragonimus heterotremus]